MSIISKVESAADVGRVVASRAGANDLGLAQNVVESGHAGDPHGESIEQHLSARDGLLRRSIAAARVGPVGVQSESIGVKAAPGVDAGGEGLSGEERRAAIRALRGRSPARLSADWAVNSEVSRFTICL